MLKCYQNIANEISLCEKLLLSVSADKHKNASKGLMKVKKKIVIFAMWQLFTVVFECHVIACIKIKVNNE